MAVSAASSQSATGLVMQQLRLQQAQRSADRAELTARTLRVQASEAQQEADRAQEGARALQVRSDQAQSQVGAAKQRVVSLESLGELQGNFDALRGEIAQGLQALDQPAAQPASQAVASPVVNAEGQTTGTLVNVTA
jgi:hypothetical protein